MTPITICGYPASSNIYRFELSQSGRTVKGTYRLGFGLEVGFGLPDLREPRLTRREVRKGLTHRVLIQLDRA